VLGALAQAFPGRIPAASQGTMNNVLIGGDDPFRSRRYAYYETICGGAGGGPQGPGASAVHTHMTNTRNTPIEALELHYPLRVRRYAIRDVSGGAGAAPGGAGVIREIELLAPAHVSILSERRETGPPGIAGGADGMLGRNTTASPGGASEPAPAKFSMSMDPGTVITVETPGGGGFGPAEESKK
jgi:N-methylhydantoinase B